MKSYLLTTKAIIFTILLLACSGILANNTDNGVVEVSNLLELRDQDADDETIYELTGEVILIYQQSFRNKKWLQDEGAGIEIDDPGGVITTIYELGDGITGIKGTLNIHQGNYQFSPIEDPGEPSSTGNDMTAVTRTLDQLTADDQGRLVHIVDLMFDEEYHGDNFGTGTNYDVSDPTGTGTFRTHFFQADYIGAPIPTEAIEVTAVLHMFHENIQFTARGLADMGITDMHNIAALRNQTAGDGTVFTLTNEVFLTFQQSFRNNKFVQDETAGILIDDNAGIITTEYEIYDGITGIQGTLSEFGNMLQFVPEEDPGAATSSENVVEPVVLTMEDYIDNFMQYQSRLVTIENVYFLDAGETFANGEVYDFTDDEFVAEFRTTFFNVDYIGDPIPAGDLHLTGLPNSRTEGDFLTARHWGDIEALTTYAVTFEFIDEGNNVIDGVSLTFRGETIDEGPYHFPEVPVGSHPYTATKEGYHTKQGVVSVVDDDLEVQIVMIEIDPDMVTEFPWEENFDGPDFPPQGWNHFALGAGGWEVQNEQAYHNYTSAGEMADSWLITPQIQLPDDEILLLNFFERNQFMDDYGYSGVLISSGSGNPEHGDFNEIYESSGNIGIDNPKETMLNLGDYAGKVVYLAFRYEGEFAHRWWVYDLVIDFAPEAIEVPNIAAFKEQTISADLIYRITGEVIITCLQTAYRGQFYVQDETGGLLVDDAPGIVTTEYELYDGITGFTGNLGVFQNMLQILPTEDPGDATSHENIVEPLEVTLADIEYDSDEIPFEDQGLLVVVRNVSFDLDQSPPDFTHNASYYIFDDTAEGLIRTPNSEGLFDYFGTPVPDTPKDIVGVLHQRFDVVRLQPRMLADFSDPETNVVLPEITDIIVYPNPATSQINIESKGSKIDMISMYNLSGQLLREFNAGGTDMVTFDVNGFNHGMYLLRIVMDDNVVTRKIQITK